MTSETPYAPKPADPPACVRPERQEPQGEPLIDFENAVKWAGIVAKYTLSPVVALEANAGRALLALKAERDALKHDIACLETKIGIERRAGEAAIAENAALKAEVSRLQREMSGSLPSILHAEGGELKP